MNFRMMHAYGIFWCTISALNSQYWPLLCIECTLTHNASVRRCEHLFHKRQMKPRQIQFRSNSVAGYLTVIASLEQSGLRQYFGQELLSLYFKYILSSSVKSIMEHSARAKMLLQNIYSSFHFNGSVQNCVRWTGKVNNNTATDGIMYQFIMSCISMSYFHIIENQRSKISDNSAANIKVILENNEH